MVLFSLTKDRHKMCGPPSPRIIHHHSSRANDHPKWKELHCSPVNWLFLQKPVKSKRKKGQYINFNQIYPMCSSGKVVIICCKVGQMMTTMNFKGSLNYSWCNAVLLKGNFYV